MPLNKYYVLLLAISLVLIYSCSSIIEVSEDYSSSETPYSFNLGKDSVFDYRYKFEFGYEYSQGIWSKIGNNEIVLNSRVKNRTLQLKVKESIAHEAEQENFFYVNINMPDSDKNYYQCMIFINDTLYGKRSCDSIASILISSPIKNIFFKLSADVRMPTRFMDTLTTDKFSPRLSIGNKTKIDIIFKDSLFNYRVFNDEILKVTRKGLKFRDSRTGQWQYINRRQ